MSFEKVAYICHIKPGTHLGIAGLKQTNVRCGTDYVMGIRDWIWKVLTGQTVRREPVVQGPPVDPEGPVWCVVANICHNRLDKTTNPPTFRRGTKNFAPGSKVYVFNFFWGDAGERVTVIGRHRKSKRLITLIMNASDLANWRPELVYSPRLIAKILKNGEFSRFPRGSAESKICAEEIATYYMQQGATTQPYNTRPPSA